MARQKLAVELICENDHWVGVLDVGSRETRTPTHCPHANCGTALSPYKRPRRALTGLEGGQR